VDDWGAGGALLSPGLGIFSAFTRSPTELPPCETVRRTRTHALWIEGGTLFCRRSVLRLTPVFGEAEAATT
jgi:hypothetical protein